MDPKLTYEQFLADAKPTLAKSGYTWEDFTEKKMRAGYAAYLVEYEASKGGVAGHAWSVLAGFKEAKAKLYIAWLKLWTLVFNSLPR